MKTQVAQRMTAGTIYNPRSHQIADDIAGTFTSMSAQQFRPISLPPEQLSRQPGQQSDMQLQPQTNHLAHRGTGKLRDKIAVITGGDSGIGRAIALAFAKEEADVAIIYLSEDKDAAETAQLVTDEGRRCLLLRGDLADENFCRAAIERATLEYSKIDILINNAGEQHPQEKIENISAEQLEQTFRTNVFPLFYLTKAVLPQLKKGSTIVNTASVTAYKGNPVLIDYSATKGAIIGFTRSLALSLASRGIRVNAVAPGPIWTPLIPSTFSPEQVKTFGQDVPLGRAGQPDEVAMAFLYLASEDSSYVTGQTIHVNGGTIVNS